MNIQTSIDLTITVGGAATNTATVSKNHGELRKVTQGEVILVSFVCAAVLLFLCWSCCWPRLLRSLFEQHLTRGYGISEVINNFTEDGMRWWIRVDMEIQNTSTLMLSSFVYPINIFLQDVAQFSRRVPYLVQQSFAFESRTINRTSDQQPP